MKTVIVGRDSNVSRHLAAKLSDCALVSARELLSDPRLLDQFRGEPVRIVVNAFRPSDRIRETADRESFVSESMLPLARVLDSCRRLEVDRLIYSSSASVYGANPDCHEDDQPAPGNVHAALKLASEILVDQACSEDGHTFTIARLFNVYGGGDTFSVISKLIRAVRGAEVLTVLNEGRSARDYVHVDDVVATYLALLDHPSPPPRVNVGSGRGVSLRELLDVLRSAGIEPATSSVTRPELERSIASVGRLRRIIDPASFQRVEDYLLKACL